MEREIDVEQVSDDFKAAICLSNVEKTYKVNRNKSFRAIRNMNIQIYNGQITAILGHLLNLYFKIK